MPDLFTADIEKQKVLENSRFAMQEKTTTAISPTLEENDHSHLLASFCQHPGKIHFQTQEEDEELLLLLRRHGITNIPWIIATIILFFIPLFLSFLPHDTGFSLDFIPPAFLLILTAFYYLIVFAYFFINFISWFYNISFVTTKRVVDIDFSDVVYKNVAATKLSLVQDVSFSQIGVIRSMFNYGDVIVQTAGTLDNFDFLAVPHPDKVVQIIENLIGKRTHGI